MYRSKGIYPPNIVAVTSTTIGMGRRSQRVGTSDHVFRKDLVMYTGPSECYIT